MGKNPENKTQTRETTGIFTFVIENGYSRGGMPLANNRGTYPAGFVNRQEYIRCGQDIQDFKNDLVLNPENYLERLASFIEKNSETFGQHNCLKVFKSLLLEIGLLREEQRKEIRDLMKTRDIEEVRKISSAFSGKENKFSVKNSEIEAFKQKALEITGPIVMCIQKHCEGKKQPEAVIESIHGNDHATVH